MCPNYTTICNILSFLHAVSIDTNIVDNLAHLEDHIAMKASSFFLTLFVGETRAGRKEADKDSEHGNL